MKVRLRKAIGLQKAVKKFGVLNRLYGCSEEVLRRSKRFTNISWTAISI